MAEIIYKNQSKLDIRLACGIPLSGASEVAIKFKKPSGAKGKWEAHIYDESKGIIEYNIRNNPSIIDEAGQWTIWPYITFLNDGSVPGDPYRFLVKEEGE